MQLGLFNNPDTYKCIKVAWRMPWISTVDMAKTQDKCKKLQVDGGDSVPAAG